MIKLRPISGSQTFSIIPSSFAASDLNAATLVLINDETNVQDEGATFTWELSDNGNYVEVSLTPSVTFAEGQMYDIEISTATNVYYRDNIFITSQTNKKQVYSATDITEYESGDNEYIVY